MNEKRQHTQNIHSYLVKNSARVEKDESAAQGRNGHHL